MAKSNRVLVFENRDVKFPLAKICYLQQSTLDHIQIWLTSREKPHKRFYFKKWWLEHGEVCDLIRESCSQCMEANDATTNICIKLRCLKKVLWRWKWHFRNEGRIEKDDILKEMEILEKLEKTHNLSLDENSIIL